MIRANAALGVCSTASTRSLRWISSRSLAPGDGSCCGVMPEPPPHSATPQDCIFHTPSSGAASPFGLLEIQRKLRFCRKTAQMDKHNITLFQSLRSKIRYSADQRNFSADQRIKAALTTE